MGWPGVLCRGSYKTPPAQEDIVLISNCDIENHIIDNGRWVIINGNVYDIEKYE